MLKYITLFIALIFTSCSSDLSNDAKELYVTMNHFADHFAQINDLDVGAIGVGTDKNKDGNYKVSNVKLSFQAKRKVSQEQLRKLLIEGSDQLLQALNSNDKLQSYLIEFPYPIEGVNLVIFIQDENGNKVFHPNLAGGKIYKKKLTYWTNDLSDSYKYFEEIEEPYEEAMKRNAKDG